MNKNLEETEKMLLASQTEAKAHKEAVESKSDNPIMLDLERQVAESQEKLKKLEEEKQNMKELLDEAGEDFLEKSNEVSALLKTVKDQEQQIQQQTLTLTELNAQIEESRLLLTDSAQRLEEKEKQAIDLEEQLEQMTPGKEEMEELEQLKDELEASLVEAKQQIIAHEKEKSGLLLQISEIKEEKLAMDAKDLEHAKKVEELENLIKKKIAKIEELQKVTNTEELEKTLKKVESEKERVERELNDEIETEKTAKLRYKAAAEEKDKIVEDKDNEIERLEREVKSLIQVRMRVIKTVVIRLTCFPVLDL